MSLKLKIGSAEKCVTSIFHVSYEFISSKHSAQYHFPLIKSFKTTSNMAKSGNISSMCFGKFDQVYHLAHMCSNKRNYEST